MKSPAELAARLARSWSRPAWREQHLLQASWPVRLAIGAPDAARFRDDGAAVAQHLDAWRQLASHKELGRVHWQPRRYQSGAEEVLLPMHWELGQPSHYRAVMQQLRPPGHAEILSDWAALAEVLPAVASAQRPLLVRRLSLWRALAPDGVVQAAQLALALEPGQAAGRPLRALAVAGVDSKFFERHGALLTALLDLRFDGQASAQGLRAFLGASVDEEHWLLVVPLAPGMLPFARQRVSANELQTTGPPGTHVLLIENEQCLHLLPGPLPGVVAILGAGLNLGWLQASWLQQRKVAYWGDIDTWGLRMLGMARAQLPRLHALLMDRASFEAHADRAVPEPTLADAPGQEIALQAAERDLDAWLRTRSRGRLEQEFLHAQWVGEAVRNWMRQTEPAD